jgi:hypothetical protein
MKIKSKTLLLIFFLVCLIFIPTIKANATNTYVGVQVTATQPNLYVNSAYVGDPASLWCLQTGTTMGLSTGATFSSYIAPVSGANPTTTIAPTCPGGTIWSALLNLTLGSTYTIRIYPTSNSGCSGFRDPNTGVCMETWDVAGQNKDCYAVCGHYNQVPYVNSVNQCQGTYSTAPYCNDLEKVKGSPCTTCTAGSYTYYNKTTGDCYYHIGYDTTYNDQLSNGCGWKDPNYVRVCPCTVLSTNEGSNYDFVWVASGF